jgi:tRNA-2-methylthio-N6-dimethylallyladenosine synthase
VIDIGERGLGAGWEVSKVERHSPYIAFVPIIEGCNKFCTYCIVPYSRGREQSRVATDIVREVEILKSEGYREVHLIGQNVNSYRPKLTKGLDGFDGATPFARLLRSVAATGMERIKFTTSFPRDFHADIIKAMEEHENLCDWVHLPIQSGSDSILQAMRRGHTSRDYLRRVEIIKSARRKISLSSDVIIGFPGETPQDFKETMNLVEQCQYDALYIFKYSVRKGTPSARLPDSVSKEEKTERFLELEKLQQAIQKKIYADYVGQVVNVLVEGESAKSKKDMTGHTTCQKVINFPANNNRKGEMIRVRVSEAKPNSLYGQAV